MGCSVRNRQQILPHIRMFESLLTSNCMQFRQVCQMSYYLVLKNDLCRQGFSAISFAMLGCEGFYRTFEIENSHNVL